MEGGWVDCGQWHTVAILTQVRVPACSLENPPTLYLEKEKRLPFPIVNVQLLHKRKSQKGLFQIDRNHC